MLILPKCHCGENKKEKEKEKKKKKKSHHNVKNGTLTFFQENKSIFIF